MPRPSTCRSQSLRFFKSPREPMTYTADKKRRCHRCKTKTTYQVEQTWDSLLAIEAEEKTFLCPFCCRDALLEFETGTPPKSWDTDESYCRMAECPMNLKKRRQELRIENEKLKNILRCSLSSTSQDNSS